MKNMCHRFKDPRVGNHYFTFYRLYYLNIISIFTSPLQYETNNILSVIALTEFKLKAIIIL